jgi:hypothetical protein
MMSYSDDDDDEDGSSWIEEHLFGRGSEEESGDSYDDEDDSSEGDDDSHDNDDHESNEDDDDDDDDSGGEIDIENVKKIIRSFHNCDFDVDFDIALSADRNVTLPNQPTQASYNKPDNWRERNRIGLEKVKGQLQGFLRSASVLHDVHFYLDLNHISRWNQQYMDNDEPIVWHEPILDRYWDVLEAEIDARKQQEIVTDIKRIRIVNVEMKKERLAALIAIFRNGREYNSSTFVNFNNVNLCADGIISLSELVDVSSELECFCIHRNRFDSMDSARCLSRSLLSHASINQLSLAHCDLGSNPEILLIILQSNILYINLNSNNIDSLGAVKIAEYLESNPPIRRIDLDYNRLNDDDALLLSHALKRNTNLRQIDLHSNYFTSIGVKALITCVFDGSSLNAISESNHTLERLVLFTRQKNGSLADCIDKLLELSWIDKIILALQHKESLLKYLANVPVELIPEVLAFSQQEGYLIQHINLSIVYSTMRWWDMPLLYSYHNCVKSDAKRKRDT